MKKAILIIILIINIKIHFCQEYNLTVQTGHSLTINNICFNSTGKLLLSCGADNIIVLWDILTGRQIKSFVGHTAPIMQAIFLPDNNFVSVSNDNNLIMWDINSGAIIHKINFENEDLQAIDISKEGSFIILSGKKLYYINTQNFSNEILPNIPEVELIKCINISNSAELIAFSGVKNKIYLYNLNEKKIVNSIKINCLDIQFSNNDQYLVAAGIWGKIRRWDLHSKFQYLTRFSIPENKWIDSYLSADISADLKYFAGGNQNHNINVFNLKSGKIHLIIKAHHDKVNTIAFSPDGNYLASAGQDRNIFIWDINDGTLIKELKGVGGKINSISLTGDKRLLSLGTSEGYCKTIELAPEGEIYSIKLTPKGIKKILNWKIEASEVKSISDNLIFIKADYYKEITTINKYKIKHHTEQYLWNNNTRTIDIIHNDKPYTIENNYYYTINLSKNAIRRINLNDLSKPSEFITIFENLKAIIHKDLKIWFDEHEKYFAFTYNVSDQYITKFYLLKHFQKPLKYSTEKIPYSFTTNYGIEEILFSGDSGIIFTQNNELIIIDLLKKEKLSDHKGSLPAFVNNGILYFKKDQHKICLFDLAELKEDEIELNHRNKVTSAQYLHKENILITSSYDGTIKFLDISNKNEIASLVTFGDFDRIFITPDNYYHASKGALKGVAFYKNTQVYSFDQFDLQYNRPDIVYKNLKIATHDLLTNYKLAYTKRLSKLNLSINNLSIDASTAPYFEVKNEIPIKTKSNSVNFKIYAFDNNYKLTSLDILVNGVPVFGKNGMDLKNYNSNIFKQDIPVELSLGRNILQLSVKNEKGFESMKKEYEIFYQGPKIKPDLYFVAIGASHYENEQYNLDYAAKDALDITSLITSREKTYNKMNTLILLDNKNTRSKILEIHNFLKDSKVDDVVIIFLAGHGVIDENLDYYFATYDMDFLTPSNKGIPYYEFENILDNIKSRKKLLIIDACHSGEFDKEEIQLETRLIKEGEIKFRSGGVEVNKQAIVGSKSIFDLSKFLFADFRENSGAIVISSAGGAEYALESDKWNNGVFTYSLLLGIQERKADLNNDGKIMVSELQRYIYKKVPELTDGKQQPATRVENLNNDFQIW